MAIMLPSHALYLFTRGSGNLPKLRGELVYALEYRLSFILCQVLPSWLAA
jgi:hypothetical protein